MANDNGNGFAMGLFCGVAAGAVLGVLFAPKSGAATRRDLARATDGFRLRSMDLYDSAVETAGTISDTASDLADRGADLINSATQQGKRAFRQAKSADLQS